MYPCSSKFVLVRAVRVQGHQNVIKLVGIDDRPAQPLLLMELCAGTLDDTANEGSPLNCSLENILRYGSLCNAL